MTNQKESQLNSKELVELNNINHPAWDEPIICRVEVDLPGWLKQLTGGKQWEVYGEDEEETCISFALRELHGHESARAKNKAIETKSTAVKSAEIKLAEVTLYHNGYAVVDVDGKALFDGTLTNGTSDCAHLSYYHAESGEPITLN
ncbi:MULTISPECIES: hypothetical protein [Methylotenera]|uniref:hypothetical protein n=1 Tax=Methylotenera TaxID=359407 RepID=UPI00036820F8|nr:MULTISPECIES: hypothetical protein [Methylotenera]